jgi:parallel beta-helix repeat protein
MTRLGSQIPLHKNICLRSGKCLPSLRKLSAGFSALLLANCSAILLPTGNAQAITPSILAQAAATATVIYVNPATGADSAGAGAAEATPCKTISFALKQAQAGAIVQLAPGTYNKESGETFPLQVKSGVTLRGDETSKGQATLIIGSGSYTSPSFARQDIGILAAQNSIITGVTVTNPSGRGTGVWVESSNASITNSTFINSGREGIFVTGTGNPKIENNVFAQNAGNGVSITKSAQGEIRNNLFQNTGFGISISDKSAPIVTDNRITQNTGGIVINGSSKPVLRNNVIEESRDHGIVILQQAQPDLGTQENPGKNLIRNNGKKDPKKFFDVLNATTNITVLAVGNDIDPSRISGKVEFVASKVEPPPGGAVSFKDVSAGYWAKAYIEALASQNVIAGFPDGSFKPNEPVTRAQFAAIITKAFAPQAKREAIAFTDVKQDFWAYAVIQTASRGGFIAGFPDKTFKPQQQIQRVQALVSLSNGLGLTTDNQNVLSFYSDAAQIPKYATGAIAAATVRSIVVNYPNLKQLNPTGQATRADVAAFVYQALVNSGRLPAIDSPYLVKVR